MEQFLDRFAKIPTWQKLLVLLIVLAVVGVVYWQFWYSDYDGQLSGFKAQIIDLERKKADYEKVLEDVRKYKKDVARLEDDKKELENQLPQDKAVAALVEAFENEAKLIGVSVDSIKPDDELLGDLYAEIPIELRMSGTYHGILKFFDRVGRLPRIVNVGSIEMKEPKMAEGGVMLTATCVATTFRYLKPEERPAPPTPPAPAAPPPPPAGGGSGNKKAAEGE
ncbi:MAG TPA: type 4a pilus biogenesis protein PilO [Myxococcota bacterium]|jgi:type IV pilus assembly protein PilO|nr:type 4a pilus biogenesis protein PilO [Myxococcota bacterium]